MNPLQIILATYRATAQSEREKGSCVEELIRGDGRTTALNPREQILSFSA